MEKDNKRPSDRILKNSNIMDSRENYELQKCNLIKEIALQGPRTEYIDSAGFIIDATPIYFW